MSDQRIAFMTGTKIHYPGKVVLADYQIVRDQIEPLDLVAFGGEGAFSKLIKIGTGSNISHVGVVRRTKLVYDQVLAPGEVVEILESTTLNGKQGVQSNRMSERVAGYKGEIWIRKLRPEIRAELDLQKFFDFCMHEVGKPYDWVQAILSGILPFQIDISKHRFCSEVITAGWRAAGMKAVQHVTPANVTPKDLALNFDIYTDVVWQVKGDLAQLR